FTNIIKQYLLYNNNKILYFLILTKLFIIVIKKINFYIIAFSKILKILSHKIARYSLNNIYNNLNNNKKYIFENYNKFININIINFNKKINIIYIIKYKIFFYYYIINYILIKKY